jgi:hypothetical protein
MQKEENKWQERKKLETLIRCWRNFSVWEDLNCEKLCAESFSIALLKKIGT